MPDSTTPGSDPKAGNAASPNGVPGQQTDGAGSEETRGQAMQRAEELADRLGEQIGRYFSSISRTFFKWAARAREEAEDIWAEAQAIRARQWADDQFEAPPPKKG
jgi:hypothetical protein